MAKSETFDKNYLKYESWFERNSYAYESELLAVDKALPSLGMGLEIGAGSGRFAGPLGITLGIDPSERMRRLAAARGVRVLEGTAESIPLADKMFDYVLMVTTICFLDDVDIALGEIFRVLKPRGSVIVGFVDKDSFLGKIYSKKKNKSVFYRNAVFYSTGEVKALLHRAGFDDFRIYQTLFKKPDALLEVEPVLEGYGKGSFVVIRATKIDSEASNGL